MTLELSDEFNIKYYKTGQTVTLTYNANTEATSANWKLESLFRTPKRILPVEVFDGFDFDMQLVDDFCGKESNIMDLSFEEVMDFMTN